MSEQNRPTKCLKLCFTQVSPKFPIVRCHASLERTLVVTQQEFLSGMEW